MHVMYRTRIAVATVAAVASLVAVAPAAAASPEIRGEPKNEWPFTRPVSDQPRAASPEIRGEPKNEPPFTRPVEGPTVVVRSTDGGFDWTSAAIGATVTAGVATVAAGVLLASQRGLVHQRG
jgi:hypothetical protein